MAGKRKQHTNDFKARVALDAIRGIKTLSELSALHGVHPSVIANWKRQLLEGAPEVFSRGTSGRADDEEMAGLFEQIGRMKMEMEWLKKKL
jgi:transposase-like protein